MLTIVVYNTETREVIAVLPIEFISDSDEDCVVNFEFKEEILKSPYDYEIYSNSKPVFEDIGGIVKLKKNAFIIKGDAL